MFSPPSIRSISLALLLATSTTAYKCTPFFNVDLSFPTTVLQPNFPPFEDQMDAVQFLHNTTRRTADFVPYGNPTDINLDATIAAKYCYSTGRSNGVVQIMTHGGGFDHGYWEFGGPDSKYNQVKAATTAGYGVLVYDRLGASKSSHPDPYKIVQIPVQADILAQLTTRLKNGTLAPRNTRIPVPKKVVHVGHSIGSSITSGFIARYPELSDGVVLTGSSTVSNYSVQFPIATSLRIAKLVDASKWGDLSTGYWTWIDEVVNEFLFFAEPYFTAQTLQEAERTKVPSAIGELGTAGGVTESPAAYKGPLLIFSGAQDQILCGGECDGLLDQGKEVYSGAKPFDTYVHPNTGHGITAHKNATAGYAVINKWIESNLAL